MRNEIELKNLGGGNPAPIEEMQSIFRDSISKILADSQFEKLTGLYDSARGHQPLLDNLATFFQETYGWPVSESNLAITAGSQNTFFTLFNLFSGVCNDEVRREIVLPMTPEYIGYADVTFDSSSVRSYRPVIEQVTHNRFKYKVDIESLELGESVGAVCVSRPTNPTGNVLTDEELAKLAETTSKADVPLIVDNAYGVPFPGLCFVDATPIFSPNVINCWSLSKVGLPGLRTGIVLASEGVISALESMNATQALSTGSLGAAILSDMITDKSILAYSAEIIRPYYKQRLTTALAMCDKFFSGTEYQIHVAEGAIFIWVWFPGLPITAQVLYERLKERSVLIIPGHFFFPGLSEEWQHRHECIRISYAQDAEQLEPAIRAISEEVKRAFVAKGEKKQISF